MYCVLVAFKDSLFAQNQLKIASMDVLTNGIYHGFFIYIHVILNTNDIYHGFFIYIHVILNINDIYHGFCLLIIYFICIPGEYVRYFN